MMTEREMRKADRAYAKREKRLARQAQPDGPILRWLTAWVNKHWGIKQKPKPTGKGGGAPYPLY